MWTRAPTTRSAADCCPSTKYSVQTTWMPHGHEPHQAALPTRGCQTHKHTSTQGSASVLKHHWLGLRLGACVCLVLYSREAASVLLPGAVLLHLISPHLSRQDPASSRRRPAASTRVVPLRRCQLGESDHHGSGCHPSKTLRPRR